MEKDQEKKPEELLEKTDKKQEEKIVCLFEDTGNFHDEEKLKKSLDKFN